MDITTIDPNILLSIVNLKLRDYYSSLDSLCEEMELNKEILMQKLKSIDYFYIKAQNQFK